MPHLESDDIWQRMDMRIRIMLLLIMALLIGACATLGNNKAQQLEEDWKGKNFNDLIAAKGPPDQKLDDGQGGKILIYMSSELSPDSGSSSHGGGSGGGGMGRHSGGGSSRGGGSGGGGSSRGGQISHINNEMFWINPDGFIYRTAYQRTGP
jgi:hypothetical protein